MKPPATHFVTVMRNGWLCVAKGGVLLAHLEAQAVVVVAVGQLGKGGHRGRALAQDGGDFLDKAHGLVHREDHLHIAQGRLQGAGHAEKLKLLAEHQGDRLLAVAHRVGAGQGDAADVQGESLVRGIESEGGGAGLDTHFGEVFVGLGFQGGGGGGTGQVLEDTALGAGGRYGDAVVRIGAIKADGRGIHYAGSVRNDIAQAAQLVQDALCIGVEAQCGCNDDKGDDFFHNYLGFN